MNVHFVLPVKSFDAYFGTSSFSKAWLGELPKERIVRETSCGVFRYMIKRLDSPLYICVTLHYDNNEATT